MKTSLESTVERIKSSYYEILRLYRSVPVTELLEPTLPNDWSVKDLLAHLAAWDWRCAGLLDQSHESDMPLMAMPDIDALNQEIYQERQEWGWEDVDNDFHEAHQALLASIRDLPPERLNDDVVQEAIAQETWQHYEEHLPQLQQWHKRVMRNRQQVRR